MRTPIFSPSMPTNERATPRALLLQATVRETWLVPRASSKIETKYDTFVKNPIESDCAASIRLRNLDPKHWQIYKKRIHSSHISQTVCFTYNQWTKAARSDGPSIGHLRSCRPHRKKNTYKSGLGWTGTREIEQSRNPLHRKRGVNMSDNAPNLWRKKRQVCSIRGAKVRTYSELMQNLVVPLYKSRPWTSDSWMFK